MAISPTKAGRPAAARHSPDPYRVMIVDDSAVVRGLLARTLQADPEIEVVSTVPNGKAAVSLVKRHSIDVVVLDIEMPVMNGMDALPLILEAAPNTKVIMASTLTRRGASITIEAMAKGASDFIPKPSASRELGAGKDFGQELVAKVKALGAAAWAAHGRKSATSTESDEARTREFSGGHATRRSGRTSAGSPKRSVQSGLYGQAPITLREPSATPPRVLAVGASTGGPQALFKVLGALAKRITLPILITQHMPATFTTILAEHLARTAGVPCAEGVAGEPVVGGRMYLAPGDYHMTVGMADGKKVIRLNQEPPENFCRPAVDVMLRSVATVYGSGGLTLIMTGMGHDGLAGSLKMVEAGGTVIAQDEASSVVWGMPGAVATGGLCSAVLPLDFISSHVMKLIEEERR